MCYPRWFLCYSRVHVSILSSLLLLPVLLLAGIFPPVKNNFFCFFVRVLHLRCSRILFGYHFCWGSFLVCLISFTVYALLNAFVLLLHLLQWSLSTSQISCSASINTIQPTNARQSCVDLSISRSGSRCNSNNVSPICLYSARNERNNRIYAATIALNHCLLMPRTKNHSQYHIK